MQWIEILSLILNLVLGGGLIVTLVTLRATRKQADANAQKAAAEAKGSELQNVESAIAIWRGVAMEQAEQYSRLLTEVDKLRREVSRLNRINTQIVKLLDRITPENIESVVAQIKKELQEEIKSDPITRMQESIDNASQTSNASNQPVEESV